MKTNHLYMLIAIIALSTGCAKQQFDKVEKAAATNDPVFGENDNNGGDFGTGENDGSGDHHVGENDGSNGSSGSNGSVGSNGSSGSNGAIGAIGSNGSSGANGDHNVGENDWNDKQPDFDHYTGEYDTDDVSLICSDNRTAAVGYNLADASTLELRLVDKAGKVICKNSNVADIKSQLIAGRKVVVPNCAAATANKYALKLVDPSKSAKQGDLLNFHTQNTFVVRKSASSPWVFLDRTYDDHPTVSINVLYNDNKANAKDANCDQRASPLVVKTVKEDHSGIQLSSQKDGILFDILGENSEPAAHAKKRISWISKDSYQFLVKPDASGKVRGVDEMFGDNTKGPDGKFSDDGYMALAKYDLNKDGVIDSKDAVYKELKLWSDKNRDGKSQKDELVSLSDAGLLAVDLAYDDSFSEKDQFGNETKMKSVVKYSDGSLRLIFDLWFNYEGKRQRH